MIRIEVKHVNEPDQLSEGDVFKFNNGDTVFFIIERIQNKEYVARRLDGRTIDDVKYNLSNDAKKFSFHQGSEMVIDNVFVYGKMFKTYD